jgi:glutathione S-transferase
VLSRLVWHASDQRVTPGSKAPENAGVIFAAGPVEAACSNKAMGFVVPQGRERMMRYGRFEDVMNALEGAVRAANIWWAKL